MNFFGRSGRDHPGPATAAFLLVVMAVGAVTRAFGVDAGLIALVLATVALVLGPYVYGDIDPSASPPHEADDQPEVTKDPSARPIRSEPRDDVDPDRDDTRPA